jgi:hypothetical protein
MPLKKSYLLMGFFVFWEFLEKINSNYIPIQAIYIRKYIK